MSRPGFVLEVDDRTPPLVVHEGEGFRLETFHDHRFPIVGRLERSAFHDNPGAISPVIILRDQGAVGAA